MLPHAESVRARRVFEAVIAQAQQRYALPEDVMLEARAQDADGVSVVVARYKLYVDGRWECFQILDEVLWPSLPE